MQIFFQHFYDGAATHKLICIIMLRRQTKKWTDENFVWMWHVCYEQTTNKNWMIGISFSRDIFSYFVVFSHLTTAPRHTAKIMKYEIADQIYVGVCMTLMMTICCINIKIFSHRHFVIKIKLDDVNSYNEKIAVSYWYSYQVYSI